MGYSAGTAAVSLAEIALAIDEKFPGKIDISDLFDYPTLRDVAAFLKGDS